MNSNQQREPREPMWTEDVLHFVLALATVLFFLSMSACSGAGAGPSGVAGVPEAPGTPGLTPPSGLTAGPVTVNVRNALVGQVRQIATGADGWTAIGNDNLILECTAVSATEVQCLAYPSEPYAYDYEEVL